MPGIQQQACCLVLRQRRRQMQRIALPREPNASSKSWGFIFLHVIRKGCCTSMGRRHKEEETRLRSLWFMEQIFSAQVFTSPFHNDILISLQKPHKLPSPSVGDGELLGDTHSVCSSRPSACCPGRHTATGAPQSTCGCQEGRDGC